MPRDGTLHEPTEILPAATLTDEPVTKKPAKTSWFRRKAAAGEKVGKAETTPFDGPISEGEGHLGCLTITGQLTSDEQDGVCRYVRGYTKQFPQEWSVTARTETTTTVRWTHPGLPGLGLCLTNDGKKAMVTEPVRTRPFDAGHTVKIVEALHAWRHCHGSPESQALDALFERAKVS